MLSRLLNLKEAVSVELATSSNSTDGLSSAEWKEASEYVEALNPLYDLTVTTSTDRYPSLSIFGMLSCLSNLSSPTGFHKESTRSINARLPLHTKDKKASLAMCLDPRFKSTVFKSSTQKVMWLKDLALHDFALCPAVEVDQTAKAQKPEQCEQPSCDFWSVFDNLANSQAGNAPLSSSEWEIIAYSEDRGTSKERE